MSNPILNNNRFAPQDVLLDEPMTVNGTINKIFMLFICLLAGAAISVYNILSGSFEISMMFGSIGAIVAFILVLATCFNVKIAKYTAAPYALCEGLFLGGISSIFEAQFQGIVLQAIGATFAVLFIMLMLYKTRMITYTEKFAAFLKTSILSILAIYLIQFVASFFGRSIPGIFDASPVGILFSLVVVGFAAASLIQDFFFIEQSSMNLLSKDYEWFGAMGLMITLVWLYMEILRLFAKLNSRR